MERTEMHETVGDAAVEWFLPFSLSPRGDAFSNGRGCDPDAGFSAGAG